MKTLAQTVEKNNFADAGPKRALYEQRGPKMRNRVKVENLALAKKCMGRKLLKKSLIKLR